MNQITGIIDTNDKKIFAETEAGTLASAVLQKYHVSFYAPCGGNGTCGKCRIRVRGEISEPDERELAFLTVHSTLHLLGYDHETSEEDDRIMRQKQTNIVNSLGLSV